MNYFFITGTSRGIGKALAEILLEQEHSFVFGISREQTIFHQHYTHYFLDLRDLQSVKSFEFPKLEDNISVSLINNAATLGKVSRYGSLDSGDIVNSFNVNIVSAALLMNKFIEKFQNSDANKVIVNISSGAARKRYESWGNYCSTKSALDCLSEVIDMEQKKYNPVNPIRVFSIAPGIVDTQMQAEIRNVSKNDFHLVETFIEYKQKKQLTSPETVAKKLLAYILAPEKFSEIIIDLR